MDDKEVELVDGIGPDEGDKVVLLLEREDDVNDAELGLVEVVNLDEVGARLVLDEVGLVVMNDNELVDIEIAEL